MVALAIILTALQLYDGWTTYQIVAKLGGRERNPVILFLIERVGTLYGALLIAKGFAIVLVWVLLHLDSEAGLVLLTLAYAWVAHNNWKVYRKLRK